MAKKKKTEATTSSVYKAKRTVLTMDSGAKYEVVMMDGKYLYCESTRFRRSNPHIVKIEEVTEDA